MSEHIKAPVVYTDLVMEAMARKLSGIDGVPVKYRSAMIRRAVEAGVTAIRSRLNNVLVVAFVQGAKWWEYESTGATMWPSDRDKAEAEAVDRAKRGTLGIVFDPDREE